MSVAPYPEYKDSGVEWIGEIPAHWKTKRFRYVFQECNDKIDGEIFGEMLSVSGYRGIEIKNYDDDNRRRIEDELQGYRIVRKGQLVINTMWMNYAGLGVSEFDGHVSPAYRAFKIMSYINKRYAHHLLRSERYVKGYTSYLTGIRPNSLQMSREDLMNLPVLLPSPEEQSAIAAFLDQETGKIDALVAEQERLITLLKEKRQAVISQAVTKGLNPNAPMKDSGVEWIEQMPASWHVTRIKHAVSHVVDCLHTTPTYDGDLAFPAVRTADLDRGRLHLDRALLVSREVYEERIQRLRPIEHDVLYSREGERFGMAALVPPSVDLCLGQRMMMFRSLPDFDAGYLMWVLNSDTVYQQVLADLAGATSPHVNIGDIVNFAVPAPPLTDQQRIAEHIFIMVQSIDALVAEAERTSALLKERRAALISAAVTGKIDVRSLTPTEQEAA